MRKPIITSLIAIAVIGFEEWRIHQAAMYMKQEKVRVKIMTEVVALTELETQLKQWHDICTSGFAALRPDTCQRMESAIEPIHNKLFKAQLTAIGEGATMNDIQ